MSRILIAEDEERVASFLMKGLTASGFATTVVEDGDTVSRMARDGDFDLLILDLSLPGKDGDEVLREIRARGERMPVVILTARADISQKVSVLDQGADDYVTKPFGFDELLARVRARLRAASTPETTVLEAGPVSLDLRSRRARVGDRAFELTKKEFTLLETFLRHPGHVLTREQLVAHVWGYDYHAQSNVVDVHVGYLRRKLGEELLETVRGVGYRLAAEPGDSTPAQPELRRT